MKSVKCLNLLIIIALVREYNKILNTLYNQQFVWKKSCANKVRIKLYVYLIYTIIVPEMVMRDSGSKYCTVF
jgi:hypothetical protein